MEDLSIKEYWGIEDYSASSKSNDKLGSIWRIGLSLGKKMAVTGAVITSASLVLPPFLALSALGVAFSLPAGFAFITYACTEKLVNSLVALPSPPRDGEIEWINGDDVERWYGEYQDVQAEEKEFGEDKRKETGMGIEFVDSTNDADDYGPRSITKDESDAGKKEDENVEESVYEENATEYMKHEEQPLNSDAILDIPEGIGEAEDEIYSMKKEQDEPPVDSSQAVIVTADVGGENENNFEQVVAERAFLAPSQSKEDNKQKENIADIDEEEMRKETTALVEEMRDEGKCGPKRQDRAEQQTSKESKGTEGLSVTDASDDKGSGDLFVIPEEVKPARGGREVKDGTKSEAESSTVGTAGTKQKASKKKSKRDKSGFTQSEPEPVVVDKRLAVHVKTHDGHATTDIYQGNSSNSKRGTSNLSNAHEMVPEQTSASAKRRPKGEEQSSKDAGVNVGHSQASVESRKPMAKQPKSVSNQDASSSSTKEPLNEEKIWEQISTMRAIVGYKAAPNSSYVEELNALYIFTGVEPPASSKDSANLITIDEKLRFLMSVIGVQQSSS